MNDYRLYDDAQLLRLVAEEDQLAFSEIYNRYWKKLFAVAYNRIKVSEHAEDIVQDVFVSLWKNRAAIGINSLENYLATAVKYCVFKKIKAVQRARDFQQANDVVPVVDAQIESSVHYKRLLEIVATEVELLPQRCKLIFKYSREKNLPVKEIAKVMDISPKTVENQLNKAIRQLKLATKEIQKNFLLFFF